MENIPEHEAFYTNTFSSQLARLGWSPFFQKQYEKFDPDSIPGRVIGVHRQIYTVMQGEKTLNASLAGRLHKNSNSGHPVVGDWVILKEKVIIGILTRNNLLSRKAAGGRSCQKKTIQVEQGIAANLDFVFIVCGLDRDYNPGRIERYITLAYNCNIEPIVLLSKSDLQQNPHYFVSEVEAIVPGVSVYLHSLYETDSIAGITMLLHSNRTAALIGSSGAGKSTLINQLVGRDIRKTRTVGDRVGKGRHTTTSRELFLLPGGGMVIDNPGIREIGLFEQAMESKSAFSDIEIFARQCRFRDCSHTTEPGCRVLDAITSGELSARRLNSYIKLHNELDYGQQRQHKSGARIEKERWQHVSKKARSVKKMKKQQWK